MQNFPLSLKFIQQMLQQKLSYYLYIFLFFILVVFLVANILILPLFGWIFCNLLDGVETPYQLQQKSKSKMSLSFLRFSPEFRSSNIYAVPEHTRNQIFFERYPKIFFLQNLHCGPIRWVSRRFFPNFDFYSRNLHFN